MKGEKNKKNRGSGHEREKKKSKQKDWRDIDMWEGKEKERREE